MCLRGCCSRCFAGLLFALFWTQMLFACLVPVDPLPAPRLVACNCVPCLAVTLRPLSEERTGSYQPLSAEEKKKLDVGVVVGVLQCSLACADVLCMRVAFYLRVFTFFCVFLSPASLLAVHLVHFSAHLLRKLTFVCVQDDTTQLQNSLTNSLHRLEERRTRMIQLNRRLNQIHIPPSQSITFTTDSTTSGMIPPNVMSPTHCLL
jgi:hypothetical protein